LNNFVLLNVFMIGRPANRLEAEWDENGNITVEFVDLTPEEYAAQPTLPEPTPRGYSSGLSEEAKK
jgi:hypothetical protein